MEIRSHDQSNSYFHFYVRRFFRTYPLWAAICLWYFVKTRSGSDLFANLTFTFGFNPFIQLPHSWSLFVEEIFYLIFPFLFMFIRGWKSATAFLAVTYIIAYYWMREAANYGVPSYGYFIPQSPLANFQYFAIGILCYFLLPLFSMQKKLWIYGANILLVPVLLLFSTSFFYQFKEVIVFLILGMALIEGSVFNQILRNFALRKLGIACYSIYLFHIVVLDYLYLKAHSRDAFVELMFGNKDSLALLGVGFVALSLSFAFALVTYHLVELPFIRLGKIIIERIRKSKVSV